MGKERRKTQRTLLAEARAHQEALEAAGLSAGAVERYENALRALGMQAQEAAPAVQVLVRDIQREVEEFQAAIRKEFPGNASFQQAFRAQEPMPKGAREVLALGRHVAREATGFAQNLIKYALNAATVKHLGTLCDQLEGVLGGPDPAQEVRAAEEEIVSAARKAFSGKPELTAFSRSES
jgi:hypothetical protein